MLNNIGNVYLAKGEFSEAQTYFERALDSARRRRSGRKDLADTLHNLGETLSKDGQVRPGAHAIPARAGPATAAGDKRGAAIESYSIGTIFDAQGRYGAAVKVKGRGASERSAS